MSDDSIIASYSNGFPIYIKKINSNGTEDTTFNGGINPNYNGGSGHACVGINKLDNDKIVITTNNTYFSRRYIENGTFDVDYLGSNPDMVKDFKCINNSVFISCKYGSIFASNFTIFKYNLVGNLDTSYSNNGITETNFNGNIKNISYNINVQSSGKIILVGKTSDFSSGSIGIARFNTDGTLDATFGTAGKTITATNTLLEVITLSALSPIDDKLYVISRNNTIRNSNSQDIVIAGYTTSSNLGTSNFSQSQNFQISPNPTNSTLTITTQDKINSINIIDLIGRKTNLTNFESNKINVSNLQNGIYFIEIVTENGLQTQNFIKNYKKN